MSLNHLVERMNVKRDYVPPVAQVNDGLGIEAHIKMKAAQESLIGLTPIKTKYEKTLERKRRDGRAFHHRNKKKRIANTLQWLREARKKPEYRAYLNKLKREGYHRCKARKIAEHGIEAVRKEWREKRQREQEKLKSSMTPEQFKQLKRAQYEKRKAREIERYGGIEGYRAQKKEQTRKQREKKKNV